MPPHDQTALLGDSFFGADGGREPIRDYYIGDFQIALNAIEALRRQLASELELTAFAP